MKEGVATIEVCQKAFMNIYGITEKRIRLQREKLIAKLRRKAAESENTAVLQMLGNRVEKQKAEEPQVNNKSFANIVSKQKLFNKHFH